MGSSAENIPSAPSHGQRGRLIEAVSRAGKLDWVAQQISRSTRRDLTRVGPAVAAGISGAAASIAAGYFLQVQPGGTAPVIVVFPIVMLTAVLAGPLAGWISLFGGVVADWYLYIGHPYTFVLLPHQAPILAAEIVVATIVLGLCVVLRRCVAALGATTDQLVHSHRQMNDALAERLEAQVALVRSEAQYRASFEYASVGKVQSEPFTGKILRVNRAFAQVLGYEPDELIGRAGFDLTWPVDRADEAGYYQRFLAGEDDCYVREKRYVRKDGTPIWCRASATVARSADTRAPIMLVGVVEDIDEQLRVRAAAESARRDLEVVAKDLEQVARDRTEALSERDLLLRQKEVLIAEMHHTEDLRERLIEQLTASNEEQTRFASVASHDLREPLRMVSSFCGLLSRGYGERLDERGREFLSLAVAGTNQMSLLLDDLVDFGRLGLEASRGSWFSSNDVLQRVLETLDEPIRQSGAMITHDVLPQIYGNPIRFNRLMQNLIGNGLKFVPTGIAPEIRVAARQDKEFWEFSVSDNGIGIAERHHQQIFEPFKRLHAKSVYSGTGLGLAICRKIVEGFGGLISVNSVEGQGSTFSFTVRIQTA
jgi:PAS domain S-box-containing protein